MDGGLLWRSIGKLVANYQSQMKVRKQLAVFLLGILYAFHVHDYKKAMQFERTLH